MEANLIAYNGRTHNQLSIASVEVIGDDIIQLTIGLQRYFFDSNGKLLNSAEVLTNYKLNNYCCAQPRQEFNCMPTNFKTED